MHRTLSNRRASGLLALLLALALVGNIRSAAAAPNDAPLDLAAMVLRPADFDRPGFAHSGGYTVTPEDLAAREGSAPALVRDDGFVLAYDSSVAIPSGGAAGGAAQQIRSMIEQFTSADVADAVFREPNADAGWQPARRLQGTQTIGDESTIEVGWGTADGLPYEGAVLRFRTGNLIALVSVNDYVAHPAGGYPRDTQALETFATLLLGRIAAVRAEGPCAGLETRVLRLGDTRATIEDGYDTYARIGGQDLLLYREPEADAARRVRGYGAASDVYWVNEIVTLPHGGPYVYRPRLLRFADSAAASAWLRDLPRQATENPNVSGVVAVAGAPVFGDESATFTYRSDLGRDVAGAGRLFQTRLIALRVGNVAALVAVDGLDAPPPAAVETLATAQVGCLRASVCAGITRVPDPLLTLTPGTATPNQRGGGQ